MINFFRSAMGIGVYKPKHKTKWLEVERNAIISQISEGIEHLTKIPTETIIKLFKTDIDLTEFDHILYDLDIDTSYGTILQIRKYIIKIQVYCLIDKREKEYYIITKHTIKDLIEYIEASWSCIRDLHHQPHKICIFKHNDLYPLNEEKTLEELEIKNDENLCADLILIENPTSFSISPTNVPDLSGLNLE